MLQKKEDVSRNVLFIILIVIIFVSVLGTWTILSALDRMREPVTATTQGLPATGYISLEIAPQKEQERDTGKQGDRP